MGVQRSTFRNGSRTQKFLPHTPSTRGIPYAVWLYFYFGPLHFRYSLRSELPEINVGSVETSCNCIFKHGYAN